MSKLDKNKINDLIAKMDYNNNDYLQHYGIKGQKWGVRRFQNEDGTLTSEGKERYYVESAKVTTNNITSVKDKPKNKKNDTTEVIDVVDLSEDSKESKESIKEVKKATNIDAKSVTDITKGISSVANSSAELLKKKGDYKRGTYPDLSNEELQRRVNRMDLEKRYSDLKGDTKYVKSGQEKAREALQTLGVLTSIAGSIIGIIIAAKKIKD